MQELITHLLESCESLAEQEMKWGDKNRKKINDVFKKIERKKSDTLTRSEKIALSEFFDIRMNSGKIVAYIFVIERLSGGQFTIPQQYQRLRMWIQAKLK